MLEARSGAHVPGVVRTLVHASDLNPGVPQTAFSALIVLDVLLRWLGGNPVALLSWPALAVFIVVLTFLASVLAPWPRLSPGLVCVLPVIDIGVVGLARLDPQVGGAGVLTVIPALWLGRILGRRGAGVALVACVVRSSTPSTSASCCSTPAAPTVP